MVLFFVESSLKTTILNIIAVYASVITFVLLTLNVLGVVRKTLLPWHWIQAVNSLATCGLYILASIWVILVLEARIVIAGVRNLLFLIIYYIFLFCFCRLSELLGLSCTFWICWTITGVRWNQSRNTCGMYQRVTTITVLKSRIKLLLYLFHVFFFLL